MKLNSRMLISIAGVILLALLSFIASPAMDVAAFDHAWANYLSTNVAAAERGLWDDIAAGVVPGEAGLLWFVNNQNLDETVGYKSFVNLDSDDFPNLRARAAVSDNALFRVGYSTQAVTTAKCTDSLKWSSAQDDGFYRTKSAALPPNLTIRAICIYLTDDPDATATGRSNVLIDYIRVTSAAGAVGWEETFTGAP
ncbi:MAG: hypothetical protein HY741_18335 [Chloroflexi bacterium]|nr:hypothetical protein [Chloroflexota bacterium]